MTKATGDIEAGSASAKSDDLASELAYVRSLAEEGRNAPLVGGRFFLIWGAVIGFTALLIYVNYAAALNLGFVNGFTPWITAFVAGWGLSFMLGRRAGAKPGALTIGNQTANSVWLAVGIFISLFWITLMVVHDNYIDGGMAPYFLFSLMFPVVFGLYGVAFFATATAARLGWLRYFAYLSWGFAIVSLFLLGSPHQLLVGALGSLSCAALPGLILMRQEPSEIV
jgi:hypothetical protein